MREPCTHIHWVYSGGKRYCCEDGWDYIPAGTCKRIIPRRGFSGYSVFVLENQQWQLLIDGGAIRVLGEINLNSYASHYEFETEAALMVKPVSDP